MSSGK